MLHWAQRYVKIKICIVCKILNSLQMFVFRIFLTDILHSTSLVAGFEKTAAKYFWYQLIIFLTLFLMTNCELQPPLNSLKLT